MSRSLQLYLDDIRTSCTKIQRYTLNMTLTDFVADDRTYDAVVRNLQIIGEAVKQISPNIREQYPTIEWRKIAGLRDILAHAYFSLENETLWDIVQHKVPELLEQVQHIDLGAQD
ncbi:MAG: DUF86 domain-containing protein [Acaryochloridaceae cyanobacterium RU_4_10]|nr:DUF86 domain-containing protein [Acaryochloridaceae cyanobacterium RU_4_10]